MASAPVSPVRILTASSTDETKIFPSPNPARMGRLSYGFHRTLEHVVLEDDFDLHLWQEIHDVFGASIKLGVTLLTAKSFGLRHGDPLQSDFVQGRP